MRNVRVDTKGELRCWNCGSTSFREKRTLRSKALIGVGAMLTKKKMKCQVCGQYNDVGDAQPYKGPAQKRLGKKYGTMVNMHGADVPEAVEADVPDPVETGGTPPPPPPPVVASIPAGWNPDPLGRHELRYWDGTQWTEHVSNAGEQSTDPV